MKPGVRIRLMAVAIVLAGCAAGRAEQETSIEHLPFETLLQRLQKYGDTPQKTQLKADAAAEMMRRGPDSLRYLLQNADIRSIAVFVQTEQLVKKLEEKEVVPVLVSQLSGPKADTRKTAAYHLGDFKCREHAEDVLPLLEHDYTAGVAIRTLGKWQVTNAVPRLIPFLNHEDERKRVMTANALGEIADPAHADALVAALDDEMVTVRKSAARALVKMGPSVEGILLSAMKTATLRSKREIIRVLGLRGVPAAIPSLRALLTEPRADWRVKTEAARALLGIAPSEAPGWIAECPVGEWVNPDGSLRTSALPSRQ